MVSEYWKCVFNSTVYMEFRVWFTIAKYENDMVSLCETINVFIDSFCYYKIHFHQLGPFKLIKTMLNSLHVLLGLSPVCRGFIKRREAGILPFYSGMFPLLLLINLYRVYRQILSNHPPTLP